MQFDPWALALTGLDGEEPPTEPDFATGASPARRHCWEGTTWGPRSGAWDTLSRNLGTRKELEGAGRKWKEMEGDGRKTSGDLCHICHMSQQNILKLCIWNQHDEHIKQGA